MMFWFKKKKIVVDCFITNKTIIDCFPIDKARRFIPEDWKQMPTYLKKKAFPEIQACNISIEIPTIKKCNGFIDLFSNGFIIPMWTDLQIQMFEDNKFIWNTPHGVPQNIIANIDSTPASLFPNYGHIKINSPWLIQEKTGVKFIFVQNTWINTPLIENLKFPMGILDYKYQNTSTINGFLKNHTTISIKAGEPLVHVMPLSESQVEVKRHLVDQLEYERIHRPVMTNEGYYKKYKAGLDYKESKCPFGFGK